MQYLRGDGKWATPTNTVYTHPTTSGNKHIPSGGSAGQILRWSSDGTAVWGSDNNTTYSTGTSSASGLTKLYTGTGSATDGTMTQSAITSALENKLTKGVEGWFPRIHITDLGEGGGYIYNKSTADQENNGNIYFSYYRNASELKSGVAQFTTIASLDIPYSYTNVATYCTAMVTGNVLAFNTIPLYRSKLYYINNDKNTGSAMFTFGVPGEPTLKPNFTMTIERTATGFNLYTTNSDARYWFGTAYKRDIYIVYWSATRFLSNNIGDTL